jgi:hypothetical protein
MVVLQASRPPILAGLLPATDRLVLETLLLLMRPILTLALAKFLSTPKSASQILPDIPQMNNPSRALRSTCHGHAVSILRASP